MLPFQALVFDKSGIVYRILKNFACASLSIKRLAQQISKQLFVLKKAFRAAQVSIVPVGE
jgi:predicted amino acid-binding ACT domain protein